MSELRNDIRRHGAVAAITARIFDRLERCVGLVVWSVQVLRIVPEFDLPADHARKFAFKRLSLSDALNASRSNPDLDLSPEFVQSAFARGDVCIGAYDGDDLVSYTWRSTDCVPVAGPLRLRLEKENYRYSYKALVLPEYRGIRLNLSTARVLDHEFVGRGITSDVGVVTLSNLASLKSTFRNPNRRRIGCAGFLRRGDRFWTFRTPAVREYFSLVAPLQEDSEGS